MPALRRMPRALLILGLIAFQIGCDQATKELAESELKSQSGPIMMVGGAVKLVYAENPGAFLGLGRSLPDEVRMAVFIVLVGIGLLLGLGFLLWRRRLELLPTLAGAALIAGGMGNLIDRIARDGRVIDFLQLGLGPVKTGIFNVADVQIVIGAIALAGMSLLAKKAADDDTHELHPS